MWSWSTNVTDRRTDGRTDRRTTCDRNTAFCTVVHRAVNSLQPVSTSPIYRQLALLTYSFALVFAFIHQCICCTSFSCLCRSGRRHFLSFFHSSAAIRVYLLTMYTQLVNTQHCYRNATMKSSKADEKNDFVAECNTCNKTVAGNVNNSFRHVKVSSCPADGCTHSAISTLCYCLVQLLWKVFFGAAGQILCCRHCKRFDEMFDMWGSV